MKAIKTSMTINIEVLDINSIPALLEQVKENIRMEVVEGSATMVDGDFVTWDIESENFDI